MKKLIINSHPEVQKKFDAYPSQVKLKMENLRSLIFEVADQLEDIDSIEETLKWGEPSYITKHGSTLRMDWKEKSPDFYAMYFKCTSALIPSIREYFGTLFEYQKNRAIIFPLDKKIPQKELKTCIELALRYHKIKKLPLLGLE